MVTPEVFLHCSSQKLPVSQTQSVAQWFLFFSPSDFLVSLCRWSSFLFLFSHTGYSCSFQLLHIDFFFFFICSKQTAVAGAGKCKMHDFLHSKGEQMSFLNLWKEQISLKISWVITLKTKTKMHELEKGTSMRLLMCKNVCVSGEGDYGEQLKE